MQEGRDYENESPERDSAPFPPGEPAPPGAGGVPQQGETPGASWVPEGTEPAEPAGPAAPPPAAGDQPGPWPGQPGYPPPGYGQPGYPPPGYGPARLRTARFRPARLRAPAGIRPAAVRPAGGRAGLAVAGPAGHPADLGQPPRRPAKLGPAPRRGRLTPPGPAAPGRPTRRSCPGARRRPGSGHHRGGGYAQPPGQPPSRSPLGRAMVYVLVAVLAAAVGAGAVFALRGSPGNSPAVAPQDAPKPHTNTSGRGTGTPGLNVNAVASKVEPGMVDITSRLKLTGQVFEGTGMILTSSGLVLTNNHVINGATVGSLRVRDCRQRADLRRADRRLGPDRGRRGDQARRRVGADDGADRELQRGQGRPGRSGARQRRRRGRRPAVTSGKITGVNQRITASDAGSGTSETLYGMFRTSAPIQPGDSGGPLATAGGRVIGMNTAANPQNLGPGHSQGYSIPINQALSVVDRIKNGQGGGVDPPRPATVHRHRDRQHGEQRDQHRDQPAGPVAAAQGDRPQRRQRQLHRPVPAERGGQPGSQQHRARHVGSARRGRVLPHAGEHGRAASR